MSAILLDNLQFAYPPIAAGADTPQIMRGLSLAIPAGQKVAIMGAVGSGKTTLALILAGLVPAMTGGTLRGHAVVDGLDVAQTSATQLNRHLGLVFQEPERQLFNMTVAEEVAFGLEGQALPPAEIGLRVRAVLAQVGLARLEERAPWQLSGGQQKRLALAAVLAMRPPILVLDEPMAGLDPAGRREVAAVLAELGADTGATVVALEKDAEFAARWAERVIVLAEGQVVLDGAPTEVFRQVTRLHELGLEVPQMAALAARLPGENPTFLTAKEAAAALRAKLSIKDIAPPLSPASPVPLPPSSQPAIELRAVSFTYQNGTQALDDISLAVPGGQFVAVVGPNGSGKSTLARHLNGLLRPQAGTVAVDGWPIAGRPVGDVARTVGYVFQNPDHQIFAPTVREEIEYGLKNLGMTAQQRDERLADALATFELAAQADTPPAVLGYGLRRLITVAAVWAMRPPIWVLDEPTTGLDAHFSGRLVDSLRALHSAGHTVMLITHDLRLVAGVAERVVVLHRGRVALDGPPRQVLADAEALAAVGLRPPAVTRLSALLAPAGFPHPILTVDEFTATWSNYALGAFEIG